MKYKDEIEVMFWHGINRNGATATHQSILRVEIAFPPSEHGLVRISIEHTREDVCHPITGYGTETHYAFADLSEEELDTLIDMLETCKSKLKEGNQNESNQ
jgi:hypothetical protein